MRGQINRYMEIIIFFIAVGLLVGLVLQIAKRNADIANAQAEMAKFDREEEIRINKSIDEILEQRKKKPLLCEICTKKNKKKTYFEGLAWHHCGVCGGHGFASIYGNKGECTGCANTARFGSPSGY